jgi:glycosyltransferase involved in cell wall biosynthesis
VSSLAFIVPGPLEQVTGGYLFDRRIVEGLRAQGRTVVVHELAGRFPEADAMARDAAATALAALPDGTAAAIDGLALPGFGECLATEAKRLRLVGFVHHPLAVETGLAPAESRRLAALETRLLPLLAGVLCPSERTADAMRAYGVPAARVAVTPPGTPKPSAPPMAGSPAAARPRPLRLLCVATLTPRKGHLLLIEALAALADRDWRLLCIGSLERDAATTAAVRRAIAAHGLEHRVTLAGEWRPERLGAAYAEADAFVLPSYHEGYGMAFAEALAYGLPIVATRAGAIPETVPPAAGLLVPPGDPQALAGALARLLDEPGLRAHLAAAAAESGAALPDWPAAVRRWAAAFDRLVA